ncbi:MAG: hydrogenase maturation nickel metallochaperone HypA, partial [bacterium]
MHEMSIAQSIVEIVEETLQGEVNPKVSKVFVKIGELVAVVPESLDFCYTVITEGTPLANSKLIIEEVPVTVRCNGCGKESRVEGFVFRCPHCLGSDLKIL